MKKRFLAALMAVFMVGMVGCGNNGDSGVATGQPVSVAPDVTTEEPEETTEESSGRYTVDEHGRIYDNQLGIYVYSTEPEDEEEKEETATMSTEGGEIEGMEVWLEEDEEDNVAEENHTSADELIISTSFLGYAIISVDPATGEYTEIAKYPLTNLEADTGYSRPPIAYFSTYRHGYSENYDKMAMTKSFHKTGKSHAGWFNLDGSYTDVVEILGLDPNSDFEACKYYYSIGFSKSGYFVFMELPKDIRSFTLGQEKFYYVDPNNLNQAYEGNLLLEEDFQNMEQRTSFWSDPYYITDWMDDEHYLFNTDEGNVAIGKVGDSNYCEEFIPNEVRRNWGGVCGPDSKIAFISDAVDKYGYAHGKDTAIYIIDRNRGESYRVIDKSDLCSYWNVSSTAVYQFAILEWRY